IEYFLLLELPEEIQALVVERVARNSFRDLYGLKASSKSMKAFAERRGVYHFYDVLFFVMHSSLLKSCYAEGNPSTLYIKGVQFFFSFGLREEELFLMKPIFCCDGHYFAGIPRESVQRIGKLVRSEKWGWGLWHSDEFRQNRVVFVSAYVPSFYRCQCAIHVERQCLSLWHIDMTKDDNMCERCFWIKEIGTFLRDFEPISVIRDTRK
ncbi:unnamed protein product, partial [Brassica oleracea var. botrytis]